MQPHNIIPANITRHTVYKYDTLLTVCNLTSVQSVSFTYCTYSLVRCVVKYLSLLLET